MDGRRARTPVSTYRLQLTAEFDLDAAAAVVDYVHELGVDGVLAYGERRFPLAPGSDPGGVSAEAAHQFVVLPAVHFLRRARP